MFFFFYELTRQNQDDQTLELHDPTNGGFAMINGGWRGQAMWILDIHNQTI